MTPLELSLRDARQRFAAGITSEHSQFRSFGRSFSGYHFRALVIVAERVVVEFVATASRTIGSPVGEAARQLFDEFQREIVLIARGYPDCRPGLHANIDEAAMAIEAAIKLSAKGRPKGSGGHHLADTLSNGVQKGPPIGVEEGPPFRII